MYKKIKCALVLLTFGFLTNVSAEKIVEAAKAGDIETVKAILAKNASKLNATDSGR